MGGGAELHFTFDLHSHLAPAASPQKYSTPEVQLSPGSTGEEKEEQTEG